MPGRPLNSNTSPTAPLDARETRALIGLSGLFIGSLITANLIGSKLALVGGLTVSVGVIVIPVTFLACDLISEIFGPRVAGQVVRAGLFVQILSLGFVELGGLLPAAPRRDLGEAYAAMFSLTPRMVLASVVAYYFSQMTDVRIFHAIRARTGGRWFWLRKNVSTLVGQAVDTALFMGIFLGGVLPLGDLLAASAVQYALKTAIAMGDTPFVYFGLWWLGYGAKGAKRG